MTTLGKILALVNVVAAAGFTYLALLDHAKRQSWAQAVVLHDRAIDGLSLDDQRKELSRIRDSKTFLNAVDEAANKAAADAKGREAQALEKLLPDLVVTGDQLAKWQALSKGGKDLPGLVKDAARRWMLAQALLPLEELRVGGRREQLAAEIADRKKNFSDLQKMFTSRIDDLLRPQTENRTGDGKPGSPHGMILQLVTSQNPSQYLLYHRSPGEQKITAWLMTASKDGKDLPATGSASPVMLRIYSEPGRPQFEMTREGTGYSAKDKLFSESQKVLRGEIELTMGGKPIRFWFIERDPMDYREQVAYALFTLSQVTRPGGTPLDAPPAAQVEQWVGRRMFVDAINRQTQVMRQIAERRLVDIEYDLAYFVDQYQELIRERIPYLRMAIERQEGVLKRWQKDQSDREKEYETDQENYKTALQDLQKERAKATAALAELARWQKLLFNAQRQDAGLGKENTRLLDEIRKLESGR
jgi:hypothetical protein